MSSAALSSRTFSTAFELRADASVPGDVRTEKMTRSSYGDSCDACSSGRSGSRIGVVKEMYGIVS